MKTMLILLFVSGLILNLQAQNASLSGTWSIVYFTTTSQGESMTMDENKLKAEGAVWDLYFGEDGKFSQTSNMAGDDKMATWEGTWKTSGSNLIIALKVEGHEMELNYNYKIEGDKLSIDRGSPDGSWKMAATHRKKQN